MAIVVTTVATANFTGLTDPWTHTVAGSAIAAGSFLVIGACTNDGGANPTMSDSRSNTYTLDKIEDDGGAVRVVHFSAPITTQLEIGDTISLDLPAGRVGVWIIAKVTGLASASILDQAEGATGSSTTPDSGVTPTTTNANDLIIGFTGARTGSSTPAFSEGAGLTELAEIDQTGGGARKGIACYYKTVSATGTYKIDSTLAPSGTWAATVAAYKAAAGALTQKALTATGSFTASITDVSKFKRTITATSAFVASLTDVYFFKRTLSVASACVASLSKRLSLFKTLTATSSFTASLVRIPSFKTALTATGSFVASLALVQKAKRTLSVAMAAVASLTKQLSLHLTLTATTAITASIALVENIAGASQTKTITVINSMRRWWSR